MDEEIVIPASRDGCWLCWRLQCFTYCYNQIQLLYLAGMSITRVASLITAPKTRQTVNLFIAVVILRRNNMQKLLNQEQAHLNLRRMSI